MFFCKCCKIFKKTFLIGFLKAVNSENSVKGLRITKNVKAGKFEGVWGEFESKKFSTDNNSQDIWD